MRYPQFICCLILIFCLIFSGCCSQKTIDTKSKQPINQENSAHYQTKASLAKQAKSQGKAEPMRIAFAAPVVMVNNKKAEKKDSEVQDFVEVSFPQNSIQNIVITVLDSEGMEHNLYGELKVFKYSAYSSPQGEKPEMVIVAPDEPEYTYSSILRNGYGEFTVREQIQDPEKGEFKKGEILLHLVLGTKKKTSQGIEFGFREGAINTLEGKKAPVSFLFKENSKNVLRLSMDEEKTRLEGELRVYKGNDYTERSIVWITVDEEHKRYLAGKGGTLTLALYIPSLESRESKITTILVSPDQDPIALANKYGAMVGLLKLRRLR